MSFQAHMVLNTNLTQALAPVTTTAIAYKQQLGFINWLREFRTTSIGLSRRTGKTTALVNLMSPTTYLLVHNEEMRRYVTTQLLSDSTNELRNRVVTVTGFTYSALHRRITAPIDRLFTDEVYYNSSYNSRDAQYGLYNALNALQATDMLDPEFFVLNVGTPH